MHSLAFTWLRRGRLRDRQAPLLEIRALHARVGIRTIFEGLDLDVFDGDAVLVTGPNGCGKSTLLNLIAGIEPGSAERGSIRFAGEDLTPIPPHERSRRGIAFVRQRDNVFSDLTVHENLQIALGRDALARVRSTFGDWMAGLPLDKRASLLSGGQRQRIAWMMNVSRDIRLLLADEPEAGVSESLPLPLQTTILVSHRADRWIAGGAA